MAASDWLRAAAALIDAVQGSAVPAGAKNPRGRADPHAAQLAGAAFTRRNPAARDPAEMSAAQINKELDKLDALDSALTSDFIAAGRGHEKPSEYLRADDPLARRARALFERRSALRREVESRAGPGMRRLPRGFGPRRARNPVPPSKVKQGAQLFEDFTGHTPRVRRRIDAGRALGLPIKAGRKIPLVAFGELTEVRYRTIRDGKEEFYRHPFRASSRPLLAARHDGKRIYIVGGRYTFTDRGIVDQ